MTKRRLTAGEREEAKRLKKLEKQRQKELQKELQKQRKKATRKAAYRERQRASWRSYHARSSASGSSTIELNQYGTLSHDTPASFTSNVPISDPDENANATNVPINEMHTSNSVPILDPNNVPSIQECIDTIKNGSLPPISLDQHPSTKFSKRNSIISCIINRSTIAITVRKDGMAYPRKMIWIR